MLTPCDCPADSAKSSPSRSDLNDEQLPHSNSIQLIRNATMKITYAGTTFLTDPMFSAKGAFRPFAGIASNPTVDLSVSVNDIMPGVESIIVSHMHPDHFDETASKEISKEIPIFCSPVDESQIVKEGFLNVVPIENSQILHGITITRVGGKHGKGKILEYMGEVSGFVFQAAGKPTVYWVGDSIWCEEVEAAIKLYKPDVIITHSGGATIPGHEPIVMDAEQTLVTATSAPNAKIVAIHMEALDHCMVKRTMLRQLADEAKIPSSRMFIPEDGGIISF
ncbi:MAG: MBL fold metallo-hydrolase [Candidatus Riflebacteria bacterium]|nr:MBL fold metallo-hydrolase [Candidatus Riflebacteria bacterium]